MIKRFALLLTKPFSFKAKKKKHNPVQWRIAAKRISSNTFNIHVMAFIEAPWQIYTQQLQHIDGSLLNIEFESSIYVIWLGNQEEIGTPIDQYDLVLKEEVRAYKVAVNIVQTAKIIVEEPITINGLIHYVIGDGVSKLETNKINFSLTLNE
jgi:hypothetical protein